MTYNPAVVLYRKDPAGANTPIGVAADAVPFTAQPVRITTTAVLFQECPPGWPAPPSETGVQPVQWFPHAIPSGTTMVQFACVAAALIAAGAATAV